MQSNEQKRDTGTDLWALLGVAMLPMLCCGLPLLIGAFGFTAAGAFLAASRYWIAGSLVVLMGVVMFILSRRGKKSGMDSCCAVPPKDLPSKENHKE